MKSGERSQDKMILKILKEIERRLPTFEKFKNRIIEHTQKEYFPLTYQSLYEGIMQANRTKFSTKEFKKLLLNHNYLRLLDDIYIYISETHIINYEKAENWLFEMA